MKIYIWTDMEGISGVSKPEQIYGSKETDEYQVAREMLSDDVNAAIEGAFLGSASEVLFQDCHGSAIIKERMDKRAKYVWPEPLFQHLDESFAGMFLVGAHAMAGTLNGFLDHTQSERWFNYFINGRRCGEIGQMGAMAGHYGFEPGESTEQYGIGEGAGWSTIITTQNGEVISGHGSLLCDTTDSSEEWHGFFYTKPQHLSLERNSPYFISFSYRILKREEDA